MFDALIFIITLIRFAIQSNSSGSHASRGKRHEEVPRAEKKTPIFRQITFYPLNSYSRLDLDPIPVVFVPCSRVRAGDVDGAALPRGSLDRGTREFVGPGRRGTAIDFNHAQPWHRFLTPRPLGTHATRIPLYAPSFSTPDSRVFFHHFCFLFFSLLFPVFPALFPPFFPMLVHTSRAG